MSERIFNSNFLRVFTASFLFVASGQIVMVMLPLYLDHLGKEPSVLGTAMALSALLALLVRPGCGIFADKVSKKWLMIIGMLLMIIGMLLMIIGNIGFELLPFAIAVIAFRTIQGGGIAATTTAQMAIVVDIMSKDKIKQGLTLFGIAGTMATAVGPIIGLKLGAGDSFTRVWYGGLAGFIVAALIVMSLTYEKQQKRNRRQNNENIGGHWFWRFFEKTAFLPAAVMVLIMVGNTATVFLPSYGKEIGIKEIGLFYTIQSIVMFLTNISLSQIIHRVEKILYLIVPALGSFLVGITMLFFARGDFYFQMAAVFYGIGIAASITIINTLVMTYASEEKRGAASATVQAAVDVGFAIGSVLGGVIAGTFGYRSFYGVLMLFPVLALVMSYFVFRDKKRKTIPGGKNEFKRDFV